MAAAAGQPAKLGSSSGQQQQQQQTQRPKGTVMWHAARGVRGQHMQARFSGMQLALCQNLALRCKDAQQQSKARSNSMNPAMHQRNTPVKGGGLCQPVALL
jgi:hypothetical protein